MAGEVLKLNSAYLPVGIIGWQEAIELWSKNKAEVLDTYEDKILHTGSRFSQPIYDVNDNFIRVTYDNKLDSWKTAMEMPAVIRLINFVNPKKNVQFFESFTRQNVYDRDHGKCMYCGEHVSRSKFTFDHVIPKSRGGKTTWQNIVCCCLPCNCKKDNRTPQEAGMRIIQKPYAPLLATDFNSGIIRRMSQIPKIMNNKKWRNYIYWNVELKSE